MVKDLQKFMLNIIIVLLLSFKNISLFKSRKCHGVPIIGDIYKKKIFFSMFHAEFRSKISKTESSQRNCTKKILSYSLSADSSITITFIATMTFSESNIGVSKFKLLKLNAAYN